MWRYTTIDEKGHRESGLVNIEDYARAAEYVRKNYGMIVELKEAGRFSSRTSFRYSDKQRTYFFRQLGIILQSGVTVLDGLAIMEEFRDRGLAHICKQLQVKIQNGSSVSQAMGELPEFFTELCCNLMRSGEESGQMEVLAGELADYYQQKEQLRNFLTRATIYPLLVGLAGLGVLLLFLLVVLPNVAEMYAALNAKQSGSLQMLLTLQSFLCTRWYVCFPLVIVLLGGIYYWRRKFYRCLLKLPLISSFYDMILEIRFCKLLALLLNSGIGILEAITSASLAVAEDSKYFALQKLRMALAKGRDITEILQEDPKIFSPMMRSFVILGMRTGNLAQLLQHGIRLEEEILQDQMERMKEYLGPALLLVMAILIGFIVVSVMQPIFSLFDAVPGY